MNSLSRLVLLCVLVLPITAAPKQLEKFEGCKLVAADWADGDSFLIKKPDGITMTIRLYGVDCLETGEMNDTQLRRLRTQRRYFGITEAAPTAKESIAIAKGYGDEATDYTKQQLQKPFTIHTRMQKTPGDGKHERFYALVETTEKKDLATELVRAGLARAHGVSADGPGARTRERYKEILSDYEFQAAKRGNGIWAVTDWDKLPAERDIQRLEDEEDKIARGKALPEDFRLNPNTASHDELMKLPGVAEKIAKLIIEKQPYEKPEDLLEVDGIGPKKLADIRPYLEFANP